MKLPNRTQYGASNADNSSDKFYATNIYIFRFLQGNNQSLSSATWYRYNDRVLPNLR